MTVVVFSCAATTAGTASASARRMRLMPHGTRLGAGRLNGGSVTWWDRGALSDVHGILYYTIPPIHHSTNAYDSSAHDTRRFRHPRGLQREGRVEFFPGDGNRDGRSNRRGRVDQWRVDAAAHQEPL